MPSSVTAAAAGIGSRRDGSRAAARARRLVTLGGFAFLQGGARAELALPGQRLLAFLGLRGGSLQRSYVAGTLWQEATPSRAHASLRSALWRVHRAAPNAIEAQGTQLGLADDVLVDARDLVHAARVVLDACAAGRGADLGHAQRLRRLDGDLLPDWYDDWVELEREHLRELRLHALDAVAVALVGAGQFGSATDAALTAIAADPLRESTHRTLIGIHLAEGNASAALAHYERFRRLARERLGLPPSVELERLIAPLRRR